jgi:Lamin Tail Domain
MKMLALFILWVAIATSGCLDLDLLDNMEQVNEDGGVGGDNFGGSSDADSDVDADGDNDTGGADPPEPDPQDSVAPVMSAASCDGAELEMGNYCLAQGSNSAAVRFLSDEPAQVDLDFADDIHGGVISASWATEHHLLVAGIDCDVDTTVNVTLKDASGNAEQEQLDVSCTGSASVVVTEVLADPLGAEPAQEFVEIINIGEEDVDLTGWMLDDNGDADGDLLPAGTMLAAGEVALIVSDSFEAGAGEDPAPDQAAKIIVIESSIGSNGLKNSEAETIELYDAAGNLVSRYGGQTGAPKEGISVVRPYAELPDTSPQVFVLEPNGTSSPGVVNRLE